MNLKDKVLYFVCPLHSSVWYSFQSPGWYSVEDSIWDAFWSPIRASGLKLIESKIDDYEFKI